MPSSPADTPAPRDAQPASPARARRWRWLLVPALLLAGLIGCEVAGWPFLRGPVERALARGLDREVSLGEGFRLHLLGTPRVATDRLVVGAPADGPMLRGADGRPQPWATATQIALAAPWRTVWTALRGRASEQPLYVRSLDVDRLELQLLRNAQGRANWHFGKRPPEEARAAPELPEFGRLVVRDGRVHVEDAANRLLLDVALRTEEGRGAAPASAAAASTSASGSASSAASTAASSPAGTPAAGAAPGARLHASAEGRFRDAPLKATLESSGLLPIASSDAGTAPVPIRLSVQSKDTELRLDGSATDLLHLAALDADVRLAGPSLAAIGDIVGATLPNTPKFLLQGRLRKDGRVWQTAVRELAVGSSRLEGEFRYDPQGKLPQLSGRLGGSRLALPDLGPAFGAPPGRDRDAAKAKAAREAKVAKAAAAAEDTAQAKEAETAGGGKPANGGPQAKGKPARPDGRVLPTREFDLPSLSAMNADVKVDLRSVELGTPQLDVLAPLSGTLRLNDQVLSISDLVARASGGELRGALSLDARQKVPRWNADLRWSGVQLEKFVKPRNGRAAAPGTKPSAQPGYVSGQLGGVAKLQGVGRSTAQMLASLDGTAQLWVRKGSISHLLVEMSGIDIAESLGVVFSHDENLPLSCALAQVKVRDGVVRPEVAVIETTDTTIEIGGSLSLAEEKLALVLRAMPKDKTPLALRAPVHLEGSFAQPKVRPELGAMGLRVAAAAALATAVAPVAALLALVDLGEPEKAVCQKALERLQRSPQGGPPAGSTPSPKAARRE